MKVLVTGGAGFVGSHLCERLLDQGKTVICLDNLQTGCRSKIAHLQENPNFNFIMKDTRDKLYFDVEEIYNLACPASPVHYQKDPVSTMETCFQGTLNVLEVARRSGAKIFQASTSEVYGDPIEHPQSESYHGNVNPFGPRSCYDEGKRIAESLFYSYQRNEGVNIRIARIFNTYGPRMNRDDGRVVSNFIVSALAGKPLVIYGNGMQTRSFCYVDDLIDGFLGLMASEHKGGPVNLGNPDEFTVAELAQKVIELTGSKSEIEYVNPLVDDPARRNPDIGIAKLMFGFNPKVCLEDGLLRTIEYFSSL